MSASSSAAGTAARRRAINGTAVKALSIADTLGNQAIDGRAIRGRSSVGRGSLSRGRLSRARRSGGLECRRPTAAPSPPARAAAPAVESPPSCERWRVTTSATAASSNSSASAASRRSQSAPLLSGAEITPLLGGAAVGAAALGVLGDRPLPERGPRPDDDVRPDGVRFAPFGVAAAKGPGWRIAPMIANLLATSPAVAGTGCDTLAQELRASAVRRPVTALRSIWPSRWTLTCRIRAT